MRPRDRRSLLRWAGFAAGVAALAASSACRVGPNFRLPPEPVPPEWSEPAVAPEQPPAPREPSAGALAAWWRQFDDPQLDSLIDRALRSNLDLGAAAARVIQARGQRTIAGSALWPQISASAGYSRLFSGVRTFGTGTAGSNVNQLTTGHNFYQAGIDASWELDLFGGLRRSLEAATANLQAAGEGFRLAQVTMTAEVALAYVQLRQQQEQIAIARKNLASQQSNADIARKRFAVGFAAGLDVANADAQVATTAAAIPPLETAARQSISALSVLLGLPPADLLAELSPAGTIPRGPDRVPTGLPSDLLRRRPDVLQAEAQLRAANAQVGVAAAEFFPRFAVTGTAGWQSSAFGSLFAGGSGSTGLGATISLPIFEGGTRLGNLTLQRAVYGESAVALRQSLLAAMRDVEDAVAAFDQDQRRKVSLSDAAAANRRALDLSVQLYISGTGDFINVLVAEGSLYASENALVQSRGAIAADLIALFKALGGGWDPAAAVTSNVVATSSGPVRRLQ